MKRFNITLSFFLALILSACETTSKDEQKNLQVLCTTNIIADIYRNILPPDIQVEALMGPGVDPHTYQFKSRDVQLLQSSSFIIVNGLYLEGNMEEILPQLAASKTLINLGDSLPTELLINKDGKKDSFDPHFWMDLPLLLKSIDLSLPSLYQQFPDYQTDIQKRYTAYHEKLMAIHQENLNAFTQIPENQKKLITAHDAFSYFARAYGVEVHAIQGVSTSVDYSIKEILDLRDLIITHEIPAIFMEHSVAPQSIEKLKSACQEKDYEIKIGGTLYSDALGAENSPATSFISYLQYNSSTILNALK